MQFNIYKKLKQLLPASFAVAILLSGYGAFAQPYGNEWINYNQTYFKVKVGENGIYRIPYAALQSYGMGSVQGTQFSVFRDGVQVPVYVSNNGTLGSNDYIEFYGTKANGKMDTELYNNPGDQPDVEVNGISDTAYYFITFNSTGNNARLTLNNNVMPGTPPAAEPYCMTTVLPTTSLRSNFAQGESYYTGTELVYYYSAKNDKGEGWGITSYAPINLTYNTPNIYTGANATLQTVTLWNSKLNGNNLQYYINGTMVLDTSGLAPYTLVRRNFNINSASLNNSNTITVSNIQQYGFTVQKAGLYYPRTFNFGSVSSLNFDVPANNAVQLLTLTNTSSSTHYVFDQATNNIYHINGSGTVNVVLPATGGNSRSIYYAQAPKTITTLIPVTFKNYTQSANQGNYLILTDKAYINMPNSAVADYKSYRSSAAGGAFQAVIIEANDLYDQFGYGYEYNGLSIKRFLKYAQSSSSWSNKPEYMLIIGKGISYEYIRDYVSNPATYPYPMVPTLGTPGSDNLLAEIGFTNIPSIAIGRVSVQNNTEIANYLEKVKSYEDALKTPAVPNLTNSLWKKKGLHIAGSQGVTLQAELYAGLNTCKAIIEDTLTGATVITTGKSSTDVIENASAQIDSLMRSGVQYVNFFGHASASGFDYNLNNPENNNSSPRFPVFMAHGCDIANIFTPSTTRTISERYIDAPNGGSIAMIACDNFGWTSYLANYMRGMYQNFAYKNYGKTLGQQYRSNIENLQNVNPGNIFTSIHSQNMLLQGDPGLSVYNPDKPDYYVDESLLSSNPAIVNTTMDTFTLRATVYNLGKAINDSVYVYLAHTKVGSSVVLFQDSIKVKILNQQQLSFKVPVNPLTDVGLNNYTLRINKNEVNDEITFANNSATLQLYISENNLTPVYPYNFSIVHQQNIELKASTLNPFLHETRFIMELDTTERFNSPMKQTKNVTSMGGVIKWTVPFQMTDSTVYYWRTTIDTLINGQYVWNNSSFIYLANGSDGWNQSHYYQYAKNTRVGLDLTEANPQFEFGAKDNNLRVLNQVFGFSSTYSSNFLNNINLGNAGCVFEGGVQFVLISPLTATATVNTGQYPGSTPVCLNRMYHIEFPTTTAQGRKSAMDFIQSIPDGTYVMMKSIMTTSSGETYIDTWMNDTLTYGSGQSLYHKVKSLGFTEIDQFTSRKPFIFFGRKGYQAFVPSQVVGALPDSKIDIDRDFNSYDDNGNMNSVVIGPAKSWTKLLWQIKSRDNHLDYDSNSVKVYGLSGPDFATETLLFSTMNMDTSLSGIDAAQYKKLRMEWYTKDSTLSTPSDLRYWRVLYTPLPEAALNQLVAMEFKDSIQQGEQLSLKLGIENISHLPMDSMLVRYKLIDASNVTHTLASVRYKPLAAGDTLVAQFQYNPSAYSGKNVLYVEANPDQDQPEEYHPNNLGYLPFKVQSDLTNPIMDVTFDGVHILNKDIVSARPLIRILLKDENKHNLINDTSLIQLSMNSETDPTFVTIPFDGTICKFIPAESNGKNEAYIEYRPTLADNTYTIQVAAKDRAGNTVGATNKKYEIGFVVFNKPTITNVLNYPNPFSTATQFVFTMTGSEIPSQFKIQIISVTGKVVKEITKSELGNLHIGRNITDYRWDGRDQYGQLLGNGVYLYRVITNNSQGEDIELNKNNAVDKFFKNGYGKLYIMR
ncbi:putative type IX secretion system sortase PorU2 [Edaphocola flava]|uniref:putative type IX secretion system sortase PorU2 n=1 Tax=Edaphocola flava TaxID=2499629 RepID=UPI00100B5219|nr:C25 family cysteine peptidase [Edaphocola flava]